MTHHYNPQTGSNWTGRTPRTLESAFGPYASIGGEYRQQAKPARKPRRWTDAALAVALAVGFFVGAIIGPAILYGPRP